MPQYGFASDFYHRLWLQRCLFGKSRAESAGKNNRIEDIQNFGGQIKKIGDTYSLEILQEYGENLISQAEIFDIENMKNTLESYPKLIEQIKIRSNHCGY